MRRYRKTRHRPLKDLRRTRRSRQRGGAITTVSQWRDTADTLRTTIRPDTLISSLRTPDLTLPADNGSYLVSYNGNSLTLQYIATSIGDKFAQSELFNNVDISRLTIDEFQSLLRRDNEVFNVTETLALTESFLTGQAVSTDSIKSGDGPFYSLVLYANAA